MGQTFSQSIEHGRVAGHQKQIAPAVVLPSIVDRKGIVLTYGAHLTTYYKETAAQGKMFPVVAPATLPSSVDLRQPGSVCYPNPPVYNQGAVGSCTAQSTCAMIAMMYRREVGPTAPVLDPSRPYAYYYGLMLKNGTADNDTGNDNATALGTHWVYGIADDALFCSCDSVAPSCKGSDSMSSGPCAQNSQNVKPPVNVQKDARYRAAVPLLLDKPIAQNKPSANTGAALDTTLEASIQPLAPTIDNLKRALYYGYPFVAAFQIYNGNQDTFFMGSGSGGGAGGASQFNYIMPCGDTSQSMAGGHSVLVVGYVNGFSGPGKTPGASPTTTPTCSTAGYQYPQDVFIVRNSWTDQWGDHGYFYVTQNDMITAFADHMITLGVRTSQIDAPDLKVGQPLTFQLPKTPPPPYGPAPAPVPISITPPPPGIAPSPGPSPSPSPAPPSSASSSYQQYWPAQMPTQPLPAFRRQSTIAWGSVPDMAMSGGGYGGDTLIVNPLNPKPHTPSSASSACPTFSPFT
jgi:hypothetical protein